MARTLIPTALPWEIKKINLMANQNSSKTNFFFGRATGIAVVSLMGFFVMTGLYLNKDANLAQVADTIEDTVTENGGNDWLTINGSINDTLNDVMFLNSNHFWVKKSSFF